MDKLFKKFLEFAIGNGIVLILGVISSPIITRLILPEEMGRFSIFTMVTSLVVLVTMVGSDQAYIRYYNEEDEEGRKKLLRKTIKIPLLFNLVVGIVLILLYKPVSKYISGQVSFNLALLLLIHTTFNIISNFALIHVRMKQKAKMYSFLSILCKLVYLGMACLLFLVFRNNYIVLVLATIISNVVMAIVGIIVERKDWFSEGKKVEINTSTKEILKYGTPFIFSMSIIWIFQSIDRISLQAYWGDAEVGLYAGAMQIINLLNTVQGAFTTFWIPVAFERFSNNPNDKEFFRKINKIVTVVMLVLSIGLVTCKDLIVLFLGPKYNEAVFIFPFLVFMPIMYTISETTVIGINFYNKTKSHIYIAIASALVNVIGNIILVPSLGSKGAAISTGFSYIVFFAARTYYSNKYYKVNYDIKTFSISTIIVYVIAIYASFNRFNLIILILGIVSTAIILWLYKDIVEEGINIVKSKLAERSKK